MLSDRGNRVGPKAQRIFSEGWILLVPFLGAVAQKPRENFVMAVDYQTGALKWLLGDSTKKWYQEYPSLRRYALSLGPNTVAPIGQHALSIYRDRLLLFDNGLNSLNQIPRSILVNARTSVGLNAWVRSIAPNLGRRHSRRVDQIFSSNAEISAGSPGNLIKGIKTIIE